MASSGTAHMVKLSLRDFVAGVVAVLSDEANFDVSVVAAFVVAIVVAVALVVVAVAVVVVAAVAVVVVAVVVVAAAEVLVERK